MPNYRSRGPSVSRQLTDDEEQLDKRSSSFLQSQSTPPAAFTGSGRYGWMEKDLKMRSMQAGVLAQESALATDLGDKRALAIQNTKDTDEENAALKGLDEVEKSLAGGLEPAEAIRKASVNQKLGLNDTFHKYAAERIKGFETPENKALRLGKRTLEELQLGKETFDAEVANESIKGDKAKTDAIKAIQARNEAAGIFAEHSPEAARVKVMTDRIMFDETEDRLARVKSFGNGTDNDLAELTNTFNELDLGGITRPDNVVKMFGGSGKEKIMMTLVNKDWLAKNFAESDAKQDLPAGSSATNFATAINALTDDSLKLEESDKQQARSILMALSGKHSSDMRKITEDKVASEDRKKLADSVFQNDEEFGKQVKGILEMKVDDKLRGADLKNAPSNLKQTQIAMLRDSGLAAIKKAKAASGMDPDTNTPEERELSTISGTPSEVATKVRLQVAKFASGLTKPAASKTPTSAIVQDAIKRHNGDRAKARAELQSQGFQF